MKKNQFCNVRELKREAARLQSSLQRMDSSTDPALRQHLLGCIQQCEKEIRKFNKFLDSLSDPHMYQLFILRYLQGMSWQRIAIEMGYHDESVPRKQHNRYLKKLQAFPPPDKKSPRQNTAAGIPGGLQEGCFCP